jgi:non-heme chloroperoxidase
MIPVVKSVAIPGGVLEYVEQGTGLPVVFLHGFTDSWRSFSSVLPCMPHTLRAIAVSQRGHGDSYRPAAGYRACHFAADVAALLDSLAIERAVIVGHCMGAQVAMRFAGRLAGMVLLSGYPTLKNNPAVHELWPVIATLSDPIDPAFVTAFQRGTLAQEVPPGWLEMVVGESLKVPARIWREIGEALLRDDVSRYLNWIEADTLILWGDRDSLCSRDDQDTLATGIARARLKVYRNAGHGLHWEMPNRVATDLLAFIQERMPAAA